MAMITCEECQNSYSDRADKCPNCGCPNPNAVLETVRIGYHGVWSSGRLVIGILSILLFVIISFQSCAAGLGNALQDNNETSGTAGGLLAFMLLVAGIVAVCTRNVRAKFGIVSPTIFYWLGALFTVGQGTYYKDLPIWGGLSFLFGIVFILAAIKTKKRS